MFNNTSDFSDIGLNTPRETTTMRNMLVEAGHDILTVDTYLGSDILVLTNGIGILLPSRYGTYSRHFRLFDSYDAIPQSLWLDCITHPQHVVKVLEDVDKLKKVLKAIQIKDRLRGVIEMSKEDVKVLSLAEKTISDFSKPYVQFDPSTLSARSPYGNLNPVDGAPIVFDLSGYEEDLEVVVVDVEKCWIERSADYISVALCGWYYRLELSDDGGRFEFVDGSWKYVSPDGCEFLADGRVIDCKAT